MNLMRTGFGISSRERSHVIMTGKLAAIKKAKFGKGLKMNVLVD